MKAPNVGKLNHIQTINGVKFFVQKQFGKWRHVVEFEGLEHTTGKIYDTKSWAIFEIKETMLNWGCAERSKWGSIEV